MIHIRAILLLIFLWYVTQGLTPKGSKANVLFSKPFVTVWNAPTKRCKTKFNVDLDLSVFDIIANENEEFRGQNVTIFYSNLLGYYPFYADQTTEINGGVPQNANLEAHLAKSAKDIIKYIPREDFSGLVIIDWEAWKPVWERNWDSKDIYRQKSKELVRQKHTDWSKSKIAKEAKIEFEQAAQAFMLQTQMLGQKLRPGGLWGFYSFPSCYNYDKLFKNYTGKCPDIEVSRNNELKWLWKSCTALYPSIYLPEQLKDSKNAQKYVHYRVREGLRVANLSKGNHLPVLPYARIAYTLTMDFLTQEDLIHTIGESVVLGAAGVVLWGDAHYSASESSCLAIKTYIEEHLGRYIINVTSSAMLCSQALCSQHGRCIRRNNKSSTYLHLNPNSFTIFHRNDGQKPGFYIKGSLSNDDIMDMSKQFKCQCYNGWQGSHCNKTLI